MARLPCCTMARFCGPLDLMADSVQSTLEQTLAEFVVPQTGRPLGLGGTTVAVTANGEDVKVLIRCGFPMGRSGSILLNQIEQHLAQSDCAVRPSLNLDWQVSAHAVQPSLKALPNVRNIIAIASGKGGVGKSTVTANVALALAQEGARVGILDADVYGPSQPRILNLLGERPDTIDGKAMRPLSAYGVSVNSIGFLVDEKQAVAWRGPMVTSALNQLLSQTDWGELDYLFIDMPPGTGDIQLTLCQKVPVSGVVIVTTPQDVALADARKGVELFRKLNLPILGVVENMAMHICSECGHHEAIFGSGGGERMAAEYQVPQLGSLPLRGEIRERSDDGRPIVAADPDGPTAKVFMETALRIAGELAAGRKGYSHLFPNITVEGKQ